MSETHRASVQTLMTILSYVLRTYLSRSIDRETAAATLAKRVEEAGRDIQVEDLNLGFGDHPDHLAQGLASRSGDGVPGVEAICEANDEELRSYVTNLSKAVKVTLLIGGAQVDAAFTSGPQAVDRFTEVSVTQDLGELDAWDVFLQEYIQIKPATLLRADAVGLTAHKLERPEEGRAVMVKDDYRRPIWSYDRTGDGEAILSEHYPTAQEAAIQEHYTFRQGPNGPGRKEDLWKGISRYATWAGLDTTDMTNDELAAWAEENGL